MELANQIHDAFEHIKADPKLKKSTKQFLADQRKKKNHSFSYLPVPKVLVAVCAIALLIIGIGSYSWFLAPVSYVSIDVNPSIELALNRLDRVVSVAAYNPQGEELQKQLSLKWKKYTQAIHIITESDLLQQYLTADEELVLTVATDSEKETSLKAGVEKCCDHIGHSCRSVSVDLETASQAHGNGLSVGKYSAYLQLAQYDDSITVDDCKNMTMAQIHCQIIEHEHGSGYGHTNTHGNGHKSEYEQETETEPSQETSKKDEPESETSEQKTPQENTQETGQHGHQHRQQGHHE